MSNQQPENIVLVDGEDPALQQAYQLAKKTFRFFWRELSWEHRRIVPGLGMNAIKVAFNDPPDRRRPDAPEFEFMWVGDVGFDGRKITGTLMNDPNWVTSVKDGDRIQVGPKRLCDWMYSVGGKAYGGYTVNLMRSKMGKAERAQHDGAWGLDFGDPQVIELVPPEYLGEKPKGRFAKMFGGKAKSQDPREVAKFEHPMAENMVESLREFMQKNPGQLTEPDENGLNYLHQMALAGATSAVKLLLSLGADPTLKTKRGLTARDLATSLGWAKVVAEIDSYRG